MMNEYLKNLNRIEFTITLACTGKCRHCSEGEHRNNTEHIETVDAVEIIRKICGIYHIQSIMTFGGEALLYPETVCAIHRTASVFGIKKRQLISNGYFSKNFERIKEIVCDLKESGVNDLLLSADAFHQETIPLIPVKYFAKCAAEIGIPIKLSPAWLVSPHDENPYNIRTREILQEFESLNIPVGPGNVIFPSGNALKYLHDYFDENVKPFSPYEEDPEDIRSISFSSNGDVLNGNIYKTDILEIMEKYNPQHNTVQTI